MRLVLDSPTDSSPLTPLGWRWPRQAGPRSSSRRAESRRPLPREEIRVLLVDDDEPHIELVQRAFAAGGGRMILDTATSLCQARARIERRPPDVVIASWILPDGDGTELLAQGAGGPRFPVVITANHIYQRGAAAAMRGGALYYVVKSAEVLADLPWLAATAVRDWQRLLRRQEIEEQPWDGGRSGDLSRWFAVDDAGMVLLARSRPL